MWRDDWRGMWNEYSERSLLLGASPIARAQHEAKGQESGYPLQLASPCTEQLRRPSTDVEVGMANSMKCTERTCFDLIDGIQPCTKRSIAVISSHASCVFLLFLGVPFKAFILEAFYRSLFFIIPCDFLKKEAFHINARKPNSICFPDFVYFCKSFLSFRK